MNAIEISSVGKMYKLFDRTSDRIADVFGVDKLKFWDKSIKYREFWALRDINLTVQKGERIGIIGRNGAGKSTLLKLITGNILPTEGSISVDGSIQALMQLGTGFHPEFTGLENIRTSLSYNGIEKKRALELENDIIEFSELEDYINQPIKYYSSGMYSRLAFAVSTALEPDILIIDEVLGAGDAAFTTKCAERMKKLTYDTGATVLFVSHSMESVLEICDKAILLERGCIVERGSALEVSKIYNKKIRHEEEIRLRAKEHKVSKKDMESLVMNDMYNNVFLFRFCVDGNHPIYKHKIFRCALMKDGNDEAEVIIGAPMDNDDSNLNRVIEGVTFMDWDKPRKGNRGFFRYYMDKGGINCHAPFQLAVPKYIDGSTVKLRVEAELDSREKVYVEQFLVDHYERIGVLDGSDSVFEFDLVNVIKTEEAKVENTEAEKELMNDEDTEAETQKNMVMIEENVSVQLQEYDEMMKENSIYGTQELIIKNIDICDKRNMSKRVFTMGESMSFKMTLSPNGEIPRFTMVVDIMTRAGKVVNQVFCESESLGLNNMSQEVEICATYDPIRLGEDEYMVSIGAFKYCDYASENENESYCVADRAVFFNVKQPERIKKSMGAFAHACTWSCSTKSVTFDAVKLEK